jgi:hypothetical protein
MRTGVNKGAATIAHDADLIIFQEVLPCSTPAQGFNAKIVHCPTQFDDKCLTKFHDFPDVATLDSPIWNCLNEVTIHEQMTWTNMIQSVLYGASS